MPDTANVENLKKQAKRLLRWHQDREWTVAEQIRLLSRYAAMTDREILDADFKLTDAQELLARQKGFASWQALKEGTEHMPATEKPPVQPVFLQSAQPHIGVSDIAASCAFYERVLGFRTLFQYGEPAFFASISRDAVWLNLRHVDEPLGDPALRAREDYLSVTVNVTSLRELKQLHAEFTAAGADFHQDLKKHPWGSHDFIVKDPDGNLLSFGCGD